MLRFPLQRSIWYSNSWHSITFFVLKTSKSGPLKGRKSSSIISSSNSHAVFASFSFFQMFLQTYSTCLIVVCSSLHADRARSYKSSAWLVEIFPPVFRGPRVSIVPALLSADTSKENGVLLYPPWGRNTTCETYGDDENLDDGTLLEVIWGQNFDKLCVSFI